MTRRSPRRVVSAVFVLLCVGLYATFLIGDGVGFDTVWYKYSLVLLCLAFALVSAVRPDRARLYLVGALVFTAVADWFLLVQDDGYFYGVCAFAVAQLLHFARLCALRGVKPGMGLGARAVVFAVAAGALAGIGQRDPVLFMTAFYFVVLLGNTVEAFSAARRDGRLLSLAVGFALFVVCDVCVGLNNLASYVDGVSFGISFGNLSWVFYAPSQMLIALSGVLPMRERNDVAS